MSDILAALEQLDDLEKEKRRKPTNTKYRNPLTSSYVCPSSHISVSFQSTASFRFCTSYHDRHLTHVIATTNPTNEQADNHDHAPSPNQKDNPLNPRNQNTSRHLPPQRATASAHPPSPPHAESRSLTFPARLQYKDDYASPPRAQV